MSLSRRSSGHGSAASRPASCSQSIASDCSFATMQKPNTMTCSAVHVVAHMPTLCSLTCNYMVTPRVQISGMSESGAVQTL